MVDGLIFRPYTEKDLHRCAELALQAWSILENAVYREGDCLKLMKAYVEEARLESTDLEVAEQTGKVVGLLFGRLSSNQDSFNSLKQVLAYILFAVKFIFGRYGRLKNPFSFLKAVKQHEKDLRSRIAFRDSEVTLFIVDAQLRGLGVGRRLMDRFVEKALRSGEREIKLYTDEACTWQFYERYGFQRTGEFEDRFYQYLSGRATQGFIYALTKTKP